VGDLVAWVSDGNGESVLRAVRVSSL